MAQGVPPAQLSDDDVERELAHLHETRRETFLHGSHDALATHTERMLALEEEYLRRFPDRATPDPMRMRASNRRLSGQDRPPAVRRAGGAPMTESPLAAPLDEADEADAAEQASDVPIYEDEYPRSP